MPAIKNVTATGLEAGSYGIVTNGDDAQWARILQDDIVVLQDGRLAAVDYWSDQWSGDWGAPWTTRLTVCCGEDPHVGHVEDGEADGLCEVIRRRHGKGLHELCNPLGCEPGFQALRHRVGGVVSRG